MARVASEEVAGTERRAAPRLRAAVLGPRGGGTTRRRASDAFRLGFAVIVVAVSVPVMQANSAAELRIAHALNPPPQAISWLVSSVFWLGSVGVIVLLVILGLLVPRLMAIRWTAVAAVVTWGVCLLLGHILGPAAGRPVTGSLAGLDPSYPVTQFAVTIAVAATALPYLSRPLHRLVASLVTLALVIGAVVVRSALLVSTISSLAIGWCCGRAAPGSRVAPGSSARDHRLDHRPGGPRRGHHPGAAPGLGVELMVTTPLARRSSCRSMAGHAPTRGCWRNCGGSASTATGPRSS